MSPLNEVLSYILLGVGTASILIWPFRERFAIRTRHRARLAEIDKDRRAFDIRRRLFEEELRERNRR